MHFSRCFIRCLKPSQGRLLSTDQACQSSALDYCHTSCIAEADSVLLGEGGDGRGRARQRFHFISAFIHPSHSSPIPTQTSAAYHGSLELESTMSSFSSLISLDNSKKKKKRTASDWQNLISFGLKGKNNLNFTPTMLGYSLFPSLSLIIHMRGRKALPYLGVIKNSTALLPLLRLHILKCSLLLWKCLCNVLLKKIPVSWKETPNLFETKLNCFWYILKKSEAPSPTISSIPQFPKTYTIDFNHWH